MEQELNKCLFDRPVSHEEARQSAQNLIDAFFNNKEGKGVFTSIPVRPDNDDVQLVDYIRQQEALSRPPQTADAVDGLVLAGIDAAKCKIQHCRDQLNIAIDTLVDTHVKALSTSADSGDREGVEPVAWLYSPINGNEENHFIFEPRANMDKRFWLETPLYAHPPTLQDSGLADELEEDVQQAINDCRDADNSEMEELLHRVPTALRQPRNDGELLREVVEAVKALPVEEMIHQDPRDGSPTLLGYCMQAQGEWDRVTQALARLDQGEG